MIHRVWSFGFDWVRYYRQAPFEIMRTLSQRMTDTDMNVVRLCSGSTVGKLTWRLSDLLLQHVAEPGDNSGLLLHIVRLNLADHTIRMNETMLIRSGIYSL